MVKWSDGKSVVVAHSKRHPMSNVARNSPGDVSWVLMLYGVYFDLSLWSYGYKILVTAVTFNSSSTLEDAETYIEERALGMEGWHSARIIAHFHKCLDFNPENPKT